MMDYFPLFLHIPIEPSVGGIGEVPYVCGPYAYGEFVVHDDCMRTSTISDLESLAYNHAFTPCPACFNSDKLPLVFMNFGDL